MTQTRNASSSKSRVVRDNTTTPPPSTPETPESPTVQLALNFDDPVIKQIHSDLQENALFLGNMAVSRHVEWIDSGRQQVLVVKRDSADVQYEPAILELIAEISPNNFWLYPCAGWNGERGPNDNWEKASPFEKAKARGLLRRPSLATVSSDWKACLANLNSLMLLAKKKVAKTELNVIQDEEIKIRHSIFEPKPIDDAGDASAENETDVEDDQTIASQNSSDLGPEFSTHNMPCKFKKASEALERIIEAGLFDFSPLPATTMNGNPLLPTEYERRLPGATVLARIILSSDYFTGKGYQFYADIESLSILKPPKAVISPSPSKSPSKKRRFIVPDHVRNARSKAV